MFQGCLLNAISFKLPSLRHCPRLRLLQTPGNRHLARWGPARVGSYWGTSGTCLVGNSHYRYLYLVWFVDGGNGILYLHRFFSFLEDTPDFMHTTLHDRISRRLCLLQWACTLYCVPVQPVSTYPACLPSLGT
jgi:hypothetical protein